ncbi:MAG: hypothetical protein CVU04_04185 [Bacteroidetes bacterium HGW-Bacteroidetes-20]|nr:MAG: hypothetical protein CVU04_04185 [Bacteroidetes bacterium HGW-Bacteroidetes-20]
MKKFYIAFIISICCIFASYSQIPNGSFENWSSFGSYEEPVSWSSYNSMTATLGVFTCEKGSPGNPGNYYLKLTSKDLMGITVLHGYAICGTLDIDNDILSGFPYTGRPANLTGKWQHMIYGQSQGMVAVQMTKWDEETQSQILIASLEYTLTGMAMSWSNFSLPLIYFDSRTPDTCMIAFISSGEIPTINDFLYVDNLSFSGSVSGIEESDLNVMQVYPNPAKDQITIEHSFEIDGSSTLLITNILGEQLLTESINSTSEKINIESLQNGIYFVTLKSKRGSSTKKLIINR